MDHHGDDLAVPCLCARTTAALSRKSAVARLHELGYGSLLQDVFHEEWAVVSLPANQWVDLSHRLMLAGTLIKSALIACGVGFIDLFPDGWTAQEQRERRVLRHVWQRSLLLPRVSPQTALWLTRRIGQTAYGAGYGTTLGVSRTDGSGAYMGDVARCLELGVRLNGCSVPVPRFGRGMDWRLRGRVPQIIRHDQRVVRQGLEQLLHPIDSSQPFAAVESAVSAGWQLRLRAATTTEGSGSVPAEVQLHQGGLGQIVGPEAGRGLRAYLPFDLVPLNKRFTSDTRRQSCKG